MRRRSLEATVDRNRLEVSEHMHPDLVPGKRFPDLELPDHSGHKRRLSELPGGDPVALNFYRGWW
jgi:hypothetical protein